MQVPTLAEDESAPVRRYLRPERAKHQEDGVKRVCSLMGGTSESAIEKPRVAYVIARKQSLVSNEDNLNKEIICPGYPSDLSINSVPTTPVHVLPLGKVGIARVLGRINHTEIVPIIVDSGASISFISEQLARHLNLNITPYSGKHHYVVGYGGVKNYTVGTTAITFSFEGGTITYGCKVKVMQTEDIPLLLGLLCIYPKETH